MLSELEIVLDEFVGPPTSRRANGQSHYACFVCGRGGGKCYTLPDVAGEKHRLKCWACSGLWDVWDVIRHFRPRLRWPQQQALRDELVAAYLARIADGMVEDGSHSSSPRGPRTAPARCFACGLRPPECWCGWLDDSPVVRATADDLDAAIPADLDPDTAQLVLQAVADALRFATRRRVHPLALAGQLEVRVLHRRLLRAHAVHCSDPACGWPACVEKRDRSRQTRRRVEDVIRKKRTRR